MLTAKLLGRTESIWCPACRYQENSPPGLCLTEKLIYSPPFLHYTAVSFICYQHPQHEYHARFSGQTSPNLRKKSIYMPRIIIQSISPSVFSIGIASVPDPKGACDFKKRKEKGVCVAGAEGCHCGNSGLCGTQSWR